MTTLTQQIEALRLTMLEAEEEETHIVDKLGQRLAEADKNILDALAQMLLDQEGRRREISRLIATLASRVGYLPAVDNRPPPLPGKPVRQTQAKYAGVGALGEILVREMEREADLMIDTNHDDAIYRNGHAH